MKNNLRACMSLIVHRRVFKHKACDNYDYEKKDRLLLVDIAISLK